VADHHENVGRRRNDGPGLRDFLDARIGEAELPHPLVHLVVAEHLAEPEVTNVFERGARVARQKHQVDDFFRDAEARHDVADLAGFLRGDEGGVQNGLGLRKRRAVLLVNSLRHPRHSGFHRGGEEFPGELEQDHDVEDEAERIGVLAQLLDVCDVGI